METKDLLDRILAKENLNQAYNRVVKNKGAAGIDNMSYTQLLSHLKENGEAISEAIRKRKYTPQPVLRIEIPKPDGGVRKLGIPTVTDRTIQQAIAQVLTPIYEAQFHDHSYGFRPRRSAHQAITKALEMMNDGQQWIVDIDLEKFFDTVDHDKLISLLTKTIKDGDVISIIRKYLESGIMVGRDYEDSVVGTPQGGPLSPLLANIVLNELDWEMERRGLNFVRFADDCIIMVGSEMAARRVMRNITRFIEEKLGLKVNMTKSKVDRPNRIKFLGFGFYFNSQEKQYKAKPHAKSIERFKRKMKKLTSRSWGVSNKEKVRQLNYLIRGWVNYFRIGSMKKVCKTLDERIRTRLRVCIWKFWKKPRTKMRNLIRLGINPNWAKCTAYSRKGYARLCGRGGAVIRAISKKRLESRLGLVSMYDYYLRVPC